MNTKALKGFARQTAPLLRKIGINLLASKMYKGAGIILALHRVVDPWTSEGRISNHESLEIGLDRLEEIVNYFKDHKYRFYSLDQVAAALVDNKRQVAPFVCFTFDDGYIDNYELAYPLFKHYRVPFAIYVTTGLPDHTCAIWWYALEDLITRHEVLSFSCGDEHYRFVCKTASEKATTFRAVRQLIIGQPSQSGYQAAVQALFDAYQVPLAEYTAHMSMTWQQIKSVATDPLVTLGAHTIHHRPVHTMTHQCWMTEVEASKSRLEEMTGVEIRHFAYPYGKCHEIGTLATAWAKVHFDTAVTTETGLVYPEHRELLTFLPRMNISQYTTIDLIDLHMSGLSTAIKNRGRKIMSRCS